MARISTTCIEQEVNTITVNYYDKNGNKLTLKDFQDKVIEDNVAWTSAISAVFKRLEKEGIIAT